MVEYLKPKPIVEKSPQFVNEATTADRATMVKDTEDVTLDPNQSDRIVYVRKSLSATQKKKTCQSFNGK